MPILRFLHNILYPEGSTPLPWKNIGVLFISLFSTALTITMLFPFLPAMVKYFGKTEEEKGYYVGLIASSMFLGRCISSYFWGVLADKIGRKPVIIVSLATTCLTTLGFGISTSVPMAMAMRFLVGLGNGVIGTCKAVISELCDVSNQALGMSSITCAFTTGIMFGPAIGGFLAETGTKYPETFPEGSFFYTYPFLLPCLVNSILLALSSLLCYKWLPETVEKRKKNEKKRCRFQKWSLVRNQKSNKRKQYIDESDSLVKQNVDISAHKSESQKDVMDTQSKSSASKDEAKEHNLEHSSSNGEVKCRDDKISVGKSCDKNGESIKECKPLRNVNICDEKDDKSVETEGKDEIETSHKKDDENIVSQNLGEGGEKQAGRSQVDDAQEPTEGTINCHEKDKECTVEKVSQCQLTKEEQNTSEHSRGSHCVAESCEHDIQENSSKTCTENITLVTYVCEKEGNDKCEVKNGHLTHPKHINDEKEDEDGKESGTASCKCINKKGNLWRILRNRNTVLVLSVYVLFGFASIAVEELVHVWATTEPRLGGLDFGTNDLATYLLIIGIVMTVLQPTLLPKIERKIGCLMNLQVALIVGLFFSVLVPSLRIAYGRPVLWPVLLVFMGIRRLGSCATYLPIFILLNNSVERDLLGSVNGLGLMVSSLSKSIAPTVGGSLFSWSLTTGRKIGFPFNINLAFIFCGGVMVLTVAVSCFISESLNKPKKIKIASDDLKKSVENLLEAKS